MSNPYWEKAIFALDSKKKMLITRAVNSLQYLNESNIKMYYRAGSFGSGGNYERSVPVKKIKSLVFIMSTTLLRLMSLRQNSIRSDPRCNSQLKTIVDYFKG